MKKPFAEEQISGAIRLHESGTPLEEICREMNISIGTFYNWCSKYAGLEVNEARRLKDLESGNNRLKKLLAKKLLENEAMKNVLSKSGEACFPQAGGASHGHMIQDHRSSERTACSLMGIGRTGYRYIAKSRDDEPLRARMKKLAAKQIAYGHPLLHALLRNEGLVVNHKRSYLIYSEENLQVCTRNGSWLTYVIKSWPPFPYRY